MAEPRERYEVTYPRYESRTLNIIPDNLQRAQCGNVQMQASMAWQFFKTHGLEKPPPNWDWSRFQFQATGQSGRPPRQVGTAPTSTPKAQTYGCTCERDCASCDQGWHGSCRYGCRMGQPVG